MDFTIEIAAPIERVFALLADLPNYSRWLPPSGLYSTTEVSATPIALGTTYVDRSKQAALHGRVTAFQPPRMLAFHQEARMPLGRLSVDMRRLQPAASCRFSKRVVRRVWALARSPNRAALHSLWLYNGCMDKQQTHTSITIRVPAEIMELLRVLAKRHDRSLNGEIVRALREYTEKQKDEK